MLVTSDLRPGASSGVFMVFAYVFVISVTQSYSKISNSQSQPLHTPWRGFQPD